MAESIRLDNKRQLLRSCTRFDVGRYAKEENPFVGKPALKYQGGVPLAYDAERNVLAVDSTDTHTLVWGATGSLKTRCVINPTIKVLGAAGESMIINDPKAEIYARTAGELKSKGYEVVVVNIRDPEYGNAWNPLALPYRFFVAGDLDLAAEFANDVASNLAAETKGQTNEPFWDNAAADCLYGLIRLLFMYCRDHGLDESAVNMRNLIELRQKLFKDGIKARDSWLWRYAQTDELTAASLSGSVEAPNDTMRSILSVLDQKLRAFVLRPTLLDMLANNDIDIGTIGKRKTAVYLIIPDEKNTYNTLVSLFVKQAYEFLIYTATKEPNHRLRNRVNFVLDEFSSLPPITNMSTMIAAARSRDMRFVLAVQSYHQIKERYGNEAETIKSNCANWIYLTSRELSLLREISELCGEKRPGVPNISVYELQHFSKERAEALVISGRLEPAKVNLLDIDQFGEKVWPYLPLHRGIRRDRTAVSFEVDRSLKAELDPQLLNREDAMRKKQQERLRQESDETAKRKEAGWQAAEDAARRQEEARRAAEERRARQMEEVRKAAEENARREAARKSVEAAIQKTQELLRRASENMYTNSVKQSAQVPEETIPAAPLGLPEGINVNSLADVDASLQAVDNRIAELTAQVIAQRQSDPAE